MLFTGIQQKKYLAGFTPSSPGIDGNESLVDTSRSTVHVQSVSAPVTTKPDKDAEGVLFSLNLVSSDDGRPTGFVYIASGRFSPNFFYFWTGGDWRPIPVIRYGAIDLSQVEDTLPTVKELTIKIVSTVPGGSQIVFGIDANDTVNYALGRHMFGYENIIRQRKYPAWFFSPIQ